MNAFPRDVSNNSQCTAVRRLRNIKISPRPVSLLRYARRVRTRYLQITGRLKDSVNVPGNTPTQFFCVQFIWEFPLPNKNCDNNKWIRLQMQPCPLTSNDYKHKCYCIHQSPRGVSFKRNATKRCHINLIDRLIPLRSPSTDFMLRA